MTVVRRSSTTAKRGPNARLIRKDGKERKSSSQKPGRKPYGNKAKRSAGRKLYSYRQRKSEGSLSFPKKRGPAKSRSSSRSRSRSPARSKSRSTKLNPWADYLRKYFKVHKTGTFKARIKAASKEYQKKKKSLQKSGSKGKKRGSRGSKKARKPRSDKGKKRHPKKSSSTPKKKKSSGNPALPHWKRANMFGLSSQQVGTVKTHNGRRYTAIKSSDGTYMWRANPVRK